MCADQSLIIDDLLQQRAATLRATDATLQLLMDGLHALRNGSPDVTDEFVDRSVIILARLRADLLPRTSNRIGA